MKVFVTLVALFFLVFTACHNTDSSFEVSVGKPQTADTTFQQNHIEPLTISEIQNYLQIAESDLVHFSKFENLGTRYSDDPICPNGRVYCTGFAVKQDEKVITTNKNGKTRNSGNLYQSRIQFSYHDRNNVFIYIYIGGHVFTSDGYIYTNTSEYFRNPNEDRWITLHHDVEGNWKLESVNQVNNNYDRTKVADAKNQPHWISDNLPIITSEFQKRINSVGDEIFEKGYAKVTECL